MSVTPAASPLYLRCPTCGAQPGQPCVTKLGGATTFHKRRANTPGFAGRDEQGRQQCMTCERWKFPAIHSCPGVPHRSNDEKGSQP